MVFLISTRAAGPACARVLVSSQAKKFSGSLSKRDKYKIVVVGAGSGGLSVANQLYDRFKAESKPLSAGDIALVDSSEFHYYQPGWTLAGAGLRRKTDFRNPLKDLIPPHFSLICDQVDTFSPKTSSIKTVSGLEISYDALVVATGLQINWKGVKGLEKALGKSNSNVSSIYSYDTCDKMWNLIYNMKRGKTVFTQPFGIIKCPGAPQKIMWMAWDRFRRARRPISVDLYNGMPTMFSVKKYSEALDKIRIERNIGGYFQHDLIEVDSEMNVAKFKKADGSVVDVTYDLLHVTPPMGPLDVIKRSPLADKDGWVAVDPATLQHTNPEYANVFGLGDCTSLPTSRTVAAITAQAPVLTENLYSYMNTGTVGKAVYDGYTSCPLLTVYGEVMLAEFKYGFEPKESFSRYFEQAKSNRLFYHLSKDFFPFAYWRYMVKGKWFGPRGFSRPVFC